MSTNGSGYRKVLLFKGQNQDGCVFLQSLSVWTIQIKDLFYSFDVITQPFCVSELSVCLVSWPSAHALKLHPLAAFTHTNCLPGFIVPCSPLALFYFKNNSLSVPLPLMFTTVIPPVTSACGCPTVHDPPPSSPEWSFLRRLSGGCWHFCLASETKFPIFFFYFELKTLMHWTRAYSSVGFLDRFQSMWWLAALDFDVLCLRVCQMLIYLFSIFLWPSEEIF